MTIDQTNCYTDEEYSFEVKSNSDETGFDYKVFHPKPKYNHQRPSWAKTTNNHYLTIPQEIFPKTNWVIIEAYSVDSNDDEIPIDRVLVRPEDKNLKLILPEGNYQLRQINLPTMKT